jgi:Flp pilus assembly protein TadD
VEVVRALAAAAHADTTAQRLLGLAHLERNESAEAVAALRQAVFLDPMDALSRYFYALALYENRDTAKATLQLSTVIDDLQLRPLDEKLPDGSTTALELLQSARFLRTQWR